MKSLKWSFWNHNTLHFLNKCHFQTSKEEPIDLLVRLSWEILTDRRCLKDSRLQEEAVCFESLHLSFSWSTMPHLFSDIPDKLRLILSEAANIFLVFTMIYVFQYIFNSQFSCTCTPVFHYIVVIYLALIPLILIFILKIMKQTKTKMCAACCHGLCPQLFQLLGIGLFWGGFVLLAGDLYLCLATKYNDTLREIPCKRNSDLTLQEKSMITIYKNWSQVSTLIAQYCALFLQTFLCFLLAVSDKMFGLLQFVLTSDCQERLKL